MSVDPDEWSLIQSTLLSLSGEILIYLLIFLILLFLSACFSAIETAFSSLNIIRVRQQSRGNRKNAKAAKKVLKIHKNFSRFLSTVLVANNLVNIGASSLVTYVLSVSFQLAETGVLIATLGVSLMVITFGEIIPKNFAALYPEKIAYWVAGPVLLLTKIMHPITFGFQKMNQKIVERAEDEEDRVTATEEELIEIVETIEREGVLEQIESEIIQSAIDFDDKTVRVAMIEKDKVVYVRENISFLDLLQAVRSSPYSRIPVLAQNEDKVVGIIRQRDLFDRVVAYNG
ncbi:MAG: CNNM domain-containing protein, partial [Bacilli bacterium]